MDYVVYYGDAVSNIYGHNTIHCDTHVGDDGDYATSPSTS